MFSAEDLGKVKEIFAQLSQADLKQNCNPEKSNTSSKKDKNSDKRKQNKRTSQDKGNSQKSCIDLLPSEILVIAGIVCDVLQVNSVLVDRDQAVEIVLTGSLKKSTQLDKIMEQIGKLPFDQVIKAIMENADD